MGTDALILGASTTEEHDQGFNGEDAPGPSDPQLDSTAQPRGLCPLGTSGRWLCGVAITVAEVGLVAGMPKI